MSDKKTASFQEVIDSAGNIVDRLYKNTPKAAIPIFTQMMPGEAVRPEFTTWRDEQQSWRNGIALHDQSFHMHSLELRGPDVVKLVESLSVNSFKVFNPGAAKQFVACSPEGYLIGDAILYYMAEEFLIVVGNPAVTDWVQYHAETGKFNVTSKLDPMWALNKEKRRSYYRYQVEGPNAYKLLEELNGGPLPEIKFFRSDYLTIAGCKVRAMRHSMGGVPGLELSGPWDDRNTVKKALVASGGKYGLRQIGSLAYFTTVIESGWWAVPVAAVYTSPALKGYREWLTANSPVSRMSLGGSYYSSNIEDYYLTPYDVNYGHIIKFDHDFVGREALEKMADQPHRKKVTLVWNADDVMSVQQALLQDGEKPAYINFPLAAMARLHYDRVESTDGKFIGVAHYPGYTVNEQAMMSLASIESAYAEPGTEVVFLWGEDGGGNRSGTNIEPHKQVKIRATVAPSPISSAAQSYRTVLSKPTTVS